jgi:hypothetical protein
MMVAGWNMGTSYRELVAWPKKWHSSRRSIEPPKVSLKKKNETYGLTSQPRSLAVSQCPDNIVEGQGPIFPARVSLVVQFPWSRIGCLELSVLALILGSQSSGLEFTGDSVWRFLMSIRLLGFASFRLLQPLRRGGPS